MMACMMLIHLFPCFTDVGWNPRWPIFHERSEIPRRTRRTRGRTERKHKGKHSRTSPITHPLDNQTHKIHKVHEQQRERYKVAFIPILGGVEVLISRRIFSHAHMEVLNPRWIFSVEGPRSLSRGVDPIWMSKALSLMSYYFANPRKEVEVVYL